MSLLILLIISSVICLSKEAILSKEDMTAISIYYDEHNRPVPMLTDMSEVFPTLKTPSVKFGPLPCSCQDSTCGCCVNMNIQLFNFQRHACTNFTYYPYEFSLEMNMLWNEESLFKRNISGKNPPPICIQAPVPYLPTMDQCVRIFNIFTPGRNIHMCMNLETRIERVPVLVMQFDCMRMGFDGVALLKPEAGGGLTTTPQAEEETTTEEQQQEAANIFDPIDPDQQKTNKTVMDVKNNETHSGSPTVVLVMQEEGGEVNVTIVEHNQLPETNKTNQSESEILNTNLVGINEDKIDNKKNSSGVTKIK